MVKNYFINVFLFLCLFTFLSCQEEEQAPLTPAPDSDTLAVNHLNLKGYVQKGPFINGTAITVAEMDRKLVVTGKNFNTQIIDNKGTFNLKDISLQSEYTLLKADGFYFDEVQGEKSAAQLTLYALANVSDVSSVNVNLLSHLEKDRVLYLIQEEDYSFAEAKQRAAQEILAIFGIEKEDIVQAELLDISQQGDDNAILLAISVTLQGDNTVAELSELLANIITDIREDGALDSESSHQKLRQQAMLLDLPKIRMHLVKRYEELGVKATIPNFEMYVDSDGDGILNKDEDDTPDEFAFPTQKDVAISSEIISDEITIAGLKVGGVSNLKVSNAVVAVNGITLTDSTAQVKNGDKIKLLVTSSSHYADTVVASLIVGYLSSYFTVVTDDYKPDAFSFTAQKDVAVDSTYTSNTITISGLPHPTPASVDKGILIKNGVEIQADTTLVKNGDQLAVHLQSSDQYFTTISSKLDINGVIASFDLITDDYKPDDFSFTPIENAKRDSIYTSNTITLSELPHPTPINIDEGTLIINGKEVLGTEATVKNGDQVVVRLIASTEYETKVNSFINIGASRHEFSIITVLNPWQRKADLALSNTRRGFSIDDNIYITDDSMRIYQYVADKDQWRYKTKFPGKHRSDFVTFSIGSKAYIGSGNNNEFTSGAETGKSFYENRPERDFWEYNPSTNQWTQKADFPGENIASATSFTINNKGYVTVGYYDDPNYDYENNYYEDHIYSRQLWEYDPLTDQWLRKADFPGGTRRGAASIGFDRKGYLGGGNKGMEGNPVYGFWTYDPVADSWTEKANFTEQLPLDYWGFGNCSFFSVNGSLYFMATYSRIFLKEYDAIHSLWKDVELPNDSWYGIRGVISGKQKAYFYPGLYEGPVESWEFTPPME